MADVQGTVQLVRRPASTLLSNTERALLRFMVMLRWFVLVLGVAWLAVLGFQLLTGDTPEQFAQQLGLAVLFAGSGAYGLWRGDEDKGDRRSAGSP